MTTENTTDTNAQGETLHKAMAETTTAETATDKKSSLDKGKRISAYTFDPLELTLITDPSDPLFDRRVNDAMLPSDPLVTGFLLSIAIKGVETLISVKKRESANGQEIIVRAGKQRTKGVHIVNALGAGVPYEGDVQAIHDAIAAFGEDVEFVKKITAFTGGRPLKIRAFPANAGDDAAARLSMEIENTYRRGNSVVESIRSVQAEHEKFGTSIEDLAFGRGVTEPTIRRWLKLDTYAEKKTKPARTAPKPPTQKRIKSFAFLMASVLTEREKLLLGWVHGERTPDELAAEFGAGPVLGETGEEASDEGETLQKDAA